MNHCVLPLFSTPLYYTQIDIRNCPSWNTVEWTTIDGHDMSKNNYFLDLPEWASIAFNSWLSGVVCSSTTTPLVL
jgi:hypothetical protein